MTPQEVIKTFMSALVNHDSSITTGTAMLDDAVKASSRFLGVQNVIDNIKADQLQAERDAVEEILGSDYAGMTMSEVGNTILNAQAKNYSSTKISNAYADDQNDKRSTVRRVILERKAYIFLEKYCGIQLPEKYWLYTDTAQTYWADEDSSTGNVDTGAITGSDANITLKAGDVVYNTTMTSALFNNYAKQDGISLSGGNLIIGTGVEKTATSVVPEIGNKYTATASAAQNITTGSHDWIVVGTDKNDTVTTGGADSISSGAGNDKIVVGADYASMLTGAGDDTVEIGADVTNITFNDLDASDTVTIKGTFNVGSSRTDGSTLIVTDKTGNRTIYFSDYANSADAKINGKTLSAWLGINLSNVTESSSVTESASVDENAAVTESTGQLDGETHFLPAANENANTATSQKLSKLTLDDVTLLKGDIYVGSSKVGEISSDFPNISSFTKNGLTVNLYGVASDTSGSDSKTTKKTLDQLTADQKTILAGLFKWWAKECTKLNEESYGTGFNSSTAAIKDIDVIFYDSKGSGSTLASVGYTTINGKPSRLTLKVNMYYYKNMDADDADGAGSNTTSLLDRTLAHEMTHAIMAANIQNFSNLPQFITEGTAELTHGIDDSRSNTIFGLAYNASTFANALKLNDTGTGNVNSYAGGYMFMRYLAKQGSLQTLINYANPDAGATWSINGTTATYTVDGQTVATLTGLAKGLAVKGTEIEGISVSGNVITLSKAVLGTTQVSLGKNDNFTLALGSDLSDNKVTISNKRWSVSNGTATLKADYSTGYMLINEGKSVTYQSAKQDQIIATVTGLATTGVTTSDFPTDSTVITLKNSMLGTRNVKITKGDGYTLALAGDAPIPTAQTPFWELNLNKTTASYKQDNSAGFTLSEDGKNANYSAVTTKELTKVTGITKVTEDNKAAVEKAITISGNVITLGADALGTSNVKVTNDYTLALASGAPTPTAQSPAWDLNKTTATYKQGTSAGFTVSDDAKTLTHNAESYETLATVSGIVNVTEDNKAAVEKAITLNGKTVTIGKDALATSTVKVTGEGYTLALAANAPTAAVEKTLWEVSGTKATYKKVKTGYFTKQSDTVLAYNKETVVDTYATINGLRKDASTDSFSLSGNVITLTAAALDENPTAKTKITLGKNDEYTLKLANGIANVAYNAPEFTFNKTVATLAQTAKTAGYSASSDGKTITYVPEKTSETLATVSGIVAVTETNKAAVTKALTVSGTKIAVGKDALTTSNVTVKGDYTLALASEALKPLTKTPTWDVKGTSATYKQEQGTGYNLSSDNKTIKYSGETTVTLTTVSGIAKVTDENKDAVEKAITISGNVITIGADALGTSKITVTNDYTLKLANDSLKPIAMAPAWKFKGTTATYVKEISAGFTPSDDNKTLNYSKAVPTTLATVSGIVKVTDDNEETVAKAVSVNDSVITLGKAALGTSKITLKGEGYTLALANDAPTASTETNVWEVKGNKATYKTVNTAYFTKQDDTTYTYTPEKATATLATVTGLRKNAALDSFSLSGNVITLTKDALEETPTAKTKITLGKNDEYTLKLDNGITNVAYNDSEFTFNKTTATLAATVKTAGYSTSTDGKTITYIADKDAKGNATSTIYATVSGLVKVDDTNLAAVNAAVKLNGTTITLGADALATSKVTVKGDYTLALADANLKPTLQSPAWSFKGTAATYAQETSAGFEVANEGKALNYFKATSTTLATVNGIAKVTDDNKDAVEKAVKLSGTTITLGADALATSKVTVKGDDYTLALASKELQPILQSPAWSFKGTNAIYAQETSAGFTPSDDNKTLNYSKLTSKTLATVSGIVKVTADNQDTVAKAVSVKDNVITVANAALGMSKVSVKGEGYTLALAGDVPTETTVTNVWQVSGNKATYKTVDTAYFTKQSDTAYNYIKEKATATLATVTGLRKNAALDSFSLSGNVITLTADALEETPTAKTKITLGKKDAYTLKLDNGITNVEYNTPAFTFNKTTATLAATVKTAGYSTASDSKTITYIADKDAKGNPTSTTLATVSGIAKVDETDADTASKIKDAVTYSGNVITLGKDALATSKVTVKGDYTLAIADSLKPTLQSPDWVLKNTTATYAQETSAGFTPSTDSKTLTYSKAASKTLATVSGIVKVTDANYSTVKAALSIDDKAVTVAKAALGTSAVSVKGEGYTLTLANDAPTSTTESTLWEVSGTKAVYKTVNTGFFTQKDEKAYTYTKEKLLTTHATVNGLRKGATVDAISLTDNVITLKADALDEAPTAKTKVTLGKNDNYTLKLDNGIANVQYNDPAWSFNKNATYTATVKTAGYSYSADNKTITYIPTVDAKGNPVSMTLATLSGVKSADGISTSGKVISLGVDALNEKKVSLGKNDDFTLKLADSSLAPVPESNETWIKKGTTATLSVTMSKGYTLSDDAKTLNYANKSSDKILAQISGINKDVFISTFDAVQDGDTKTVPLKNIQLTNKVTVSGEYKFSFASDYNDATITGSASSDNISVAGTGVVVNPGKGNDKVTLGGSGNTVIYANGDGFDVIADFTAANDKLKVTKGTPEVSTSGNDAVITVGTGSVTLTNAASSVNNIVIVDGKDNQIYPAASAALLEDNHFDANALDDITDATIADNSLGDLDLNRDATALDTPTVTFSGDDDK